MANRRGSRGGSVRGGIPLALTLAGAWALVGCEAPPGAGPKAGTVDAEAGSPGYCGDGACSPAEGEDCSGCPDDCGTCSYDAGPPPGYCGDGSCSPTEGEDCSGCPEDCGTCSYDAGPPPGYCGDGSCSPAEGEDCAGCPEDCGDCPYDAGPPPGYCGDGSCSASEGEDCAGCPEDCGDCPYDAGPPPGYCGDGSCSASEGEDCAGCPEDCGECPYDGGTPGCMMDGDCDDGEFCNGSEVCLDGTCGEGMAPDCDDDKVCTVDYCGTDACVNEFSENLCVCNPPPAVDVTVTFEKELASQAIPCPVVGGSVKDELKFTANGTGALADCENGCTESLGVDAELSLTGEFCGTKGLSITASGMGAYNYTKQKCLECDEDSCEQVCNDGGCRTDSGSGSLGVTLSRFYGAAMEGGGGPVKTEFKCGATVSGGVNAGMGATVTTELSDCVECQQCVEVNGNVGATLGGAADCYVGFEVYGYKRRLGCDGCASVSASPYFGAALRDGECGPDGCAYVGVNAQARAGLSTTVGYGWFSVTVGCSAQVKGCAEASTCESCNQCAGCSQLNTSFSCRVN